jgi:hypothetical protein
VAATLSIECVLSLYRRSIASRSDLQATLFSASIFSPSKRARGYEVAVPWEDNPDISRHRSEWQFTGPCGGLHIMNLVRIAALTDRSHPRPH